MLYFSNIENTTVRENTFKTIFIHGVAGPAIQFRLVSRLVSAILEGNLCYQRFQKVVGCFLQF